jgi:putative solute:sodium symporter small subunit
MDPAAKNSIPDPAYRVNFFRPRRGFMRREVRLIWLMLGGWTLLTFGFPLYLVWLQRDPSGASSLTETSLLGFPFHYWFSGQFLIVWFIILCFLFNVLVDRLIERYRHPHPPGGRHVH